MTLEALVGRREIFGEDSRLTYYRNEIGIAHPPGYYVNMDMIGYTGSGSSTEVQTNIESVRVVLFVENRLGSLGQFEHLRSSLLVESSERCCVFVWNNHQVAACIWKQVEHDEDQASSVEYEVGGVVS